MSLVNDALRRAKEAQQQAAPPPPSQMQFRPVEPGQRARHGLGLMVPAALAVVALLALFFVWQRAPGGKATEARALTRTAAPRPRRPTGFTFGSRSHTGARPAASTEPAAATRIPPHFSHSRRGRPGGDGTTHTRSARRLPTSRRAKRPTRRRLLRPPKPAPLRLQAIIFNPKRPSALISGKTLFIGDKLGDARVVAIDQESATLVGGGKTNVLSLPE